MTPTFPKNLFFDLDGTLFRSEEDIRTTWKDTLAEMKIDCPQFNSIFRVGPSLQQVQSMLFPNISDETRIRMFNLFKGKYDTSSLPNTAPYDGIGSWLTALHGQGHRLFTMTNKRLRPTMMLVKRNGWEPIFSRIYGGDSIPGKKATKSELLTFALTEMGIAPGDAIIFGDTDEDITAGKTTGLKTCFCDWGYGNCTQPTDFTLSLKEIKK